jgi:hypothetical protein
MIQQQEPESSLQNPSGFMVDTKSIADTILDGSVTETDQIRVLCDALAEEHYMLIYDVYGRIFTFIDQDPRGVNQSVTESRVYGMLQRHAPKPK